MIQLFPESALTQLEFDKVRALLMEHCQSEYGRHKAEKLRVHTKLEFIELELRQTHEYKLIRQSGLYFPNDYVLNLSKDIRLLGIPGSFLGGEQWMQIRRLAENMQSIFRWFDTERRVAYPALSQVIKDTYYEKTIIQLIDEVLDEGGNVRDNASEDLARIRMSLYRKRGELSRVFDRIVRKMKRDGLAADIEESFMNGRRVIAVFAEHKRQVKGILHGESDTRKTSFIEPEETIGLNNDIFELENDERKEVYRILRDLTARLSVYAPLLKTYLEVVGEYDFIRGKARLAIDMDANYPTVVDKAHVQLIRAYHPLLYLYNLRSGKPTIPLNLTLDEQSRILVISGPNAGGKTVSLKTVGLLQLMLQSGLLVTADPDSTFGVFKKLMIHIGDTQSLEFELSTYSAHLVHMKHFMEAANGRTMFFIDELGSGSDPNLGGAFAEVIMEELARKHAYGIVTTHYLNLKVMAGKVPGIINGAMAFDEQRLLPMYQLIVGKPGSSYTFAIAERIGLDKRLIERARTLVDEDQYNLDRLLNRTEQDLRQVEKREKDLNKMLADNARLKKEMETVMDKERHRQQVELQREQNRITDERIAQMKDMERKLKAVVSEWKRTENKEEVMKTLNALLFQQKEKQVTEKRQAAFDEKYVEIGGAVKVGDRVKMRQNRQVGTVSEIRGKKAIVQLGRIPLTVDLGDLTVVEEKPETASSQ
ncbi:MAG TPA: MutS2/Smr-associated SH3 domain-containing protein [Dinghuibacter sp.]|nr:MutS2/Smr-associated SH3 domain-containing protein [Dinghuibacter sp.]HTJ13062.1 MutS2/Smr-associated SH3 domain-containing protein [Dinghuibacter sp.]